MKFYHKINQYLLENHPTIWNTKILWMLLVSLGIHILFFFIGFVSHANPETLQIPSAVNDYFTNGLVFVQCIISLIMLVVWLIMMFKNNAFKNFYPSSRWKLFSQFSQYFLIILACTTFYYSYMFGLKLFINYKYDDKTMVEKIEVINRTAPFLVQKLDDYTLDNRKYPEVFSQLFCEQNYDDIDFHQKYFSFFNRNYQYYKIYPKTIYKKDSLGNFIIPEPEKSFGTKIAYQDQKNASITYFFKDKVVDLSPHIVTTNPSIYNFSKIFYYSDKQSRGLFRSVQMVDADYKNHSNFYDLPELNKESFRINKLTKEILDRKNPAEIEQFLRKFLKISSEFRIKNNLDAKSWLKMVYQPENFEVQYFIKTYNSSSKQAYADVANAAATVDSATTTVTDYKEQDRITQSKIDEFYESKITEFYYSESDLNNVLENIDSIKYTDIFSESIHFFLWMAFLLSSFIFCYRITGLRSVLFSIVASGILILIIILSSVFFRFSFQYQYKGTDFFVSYLIWFIGTTLVFLSIFGLRKLKKNISGIILNIVICGFSGYILVYFIIISLHQKSNCTPSANVHCSSIVENLGNLLSYIILVLSFLFVYFYTFIIQKWKALPS